MSLLDLVEGTHRKTLVVSGGCHTCPRKRVDFVPATLRQGPVLWLGEFPRETEVAEKEYFTGQSGQLLREVATKYGVPGPWSFSATTHCPPPGNSEPTAKEVSCCLSQFVLDEIRSYPFVVMVGTTPLQALFPGAKADKFRGNIAWHPDFPQQRFYAIYHPAHLFRQPGRKDVFEKQINRLARVVRGEAEPQWQIIRGLQGLELLRQLVQLPLLSIDFETSRLESFVVNGKIRSLAVTGDAKQVVVSSIDDPYFGAMLQLLAEYVSKPEKSVVGMNIAFDLVWLEAELGAQVRCQLIHDTGIQWYEAKQYKMAGLKELVSQELDGYRYLVHEAHHVKDMELLTKYNAEDVVYPLQLMSRAMRDLKPKTRDLAARVLGPVSVVLARMSAKGIYLRQDYRQKKIDEYEEKRKQIVAAWKEDDPEFIPNEHESGDGLIQYLFGIRKLPILDRTEKGVPSTDKSVLKQLVRDGYSVCRHRLALSEVDKILSTYLHAYDKFVWPDSRVRSSYPLTWTDSGRSSSRKPNLQNIPRKKEIRDLFGVPGGSVLLESDLSQIEFRIMVCLARDENGIVGYLRGEDAHTMTARKVAGVDHPTKEQRSLAKPINFGFLYGAQAPMVQQYAADEYGVVWSLEQAQEFRNIFMATYPAIPVFHSDSRNRLLKNRGWFESAVGHVFHYEDWEHTNQQKRDHAFRAALNSEAQGPAAHIMFYIMVLTRRLLDARGFHSVEFVNTVHDSLLTEVPNPAWVPDVVATCNEAVRIAHDWVRSWFVVPLVMDHKIGQSWGSLEDYKAVA